MNTGLSTKNAPSPKVVLPHYAFGAVAFLAAGILMFFASDDIALSYIGSHALSITHVLILSWITMIIFGALYQLIPVVFEIKLKSELMAYISFGSLAVGSIMLTLGFWKQYTGLTYLTEIGGTLVIISVLLFVLNTLLTAAKSPQKNIKNTYIKTSVVWLLLTVLLGIFILLNNSLQMIDKTSLELLRIHVHIGVIGWFMMLIIGVASTLLPMFFISHKLKEKYLEYAYYLINTGLIALIAGYYFDASEFILLTPAVLILGGMLMFIKYNYDAYKKRLRRKLDTGMKLSVFAFLFFFLSLALGFVSLADISPAWNVKIQTAYMASLILGFFSTLILGQMYKTLPFIVWLAKYQDKVGRYKVPMPASLYSQKVADAHFYSFMLAVVLLLIGIFTSQADVLKFASLMFITTALLYGYNTFVIIFHKENAQPLKSTK